jgi:hypothetical protein
MCLVVNLSTLVVRKLNFKFKKIKSAFQAKILFKTPTNILV